MSETKGDAARFWRFVVEVESDDPMMRDFIEDTRQLVRDGESPVEYAAQFGMCGEAEACHRRLRLAWALLNDLPEVEAMVREYVADIHDGEGR